MNGTRTEQNGNGYGTPRIPGGHVSQTQAPRRPPQAPQQAQAPQGTAPVAGVARAGAARLGSNNQRPPEPTKELILTTVTPPFILSFCSLTTKTEFPAGSGKFAYRAQINFDKRLVDLSKPAFNQKVSVVDIIENAIIKTWGHDRSRWPRDLKDPVLDGDEKRTGDGEIANPGFWYVRATTPHLPGLFDKNRNIITDSDSLYPGCICKAEIYALAYDTPGNQGVKIYFNRIQKMADGEPLVQRAKVEDVFAVEDEDMDMVTQYQGYVPTSEPRYEDYDSGDYHS